MKCRKCKIKCRDISLGSDIFVNLFQAIPAYCENKDCEEFGYVTMVGYPDDKSNE